MGAPRGLAKKAVEFFSGVIFFFFVILFALESGSVSKIYSVCFFIFLAWTIFLLSKKILGALSAASFICLLIWISSEFKANYTGTRLFFQDIQMLYYSKQLLIEMSPGVVFSFFVFFLGLIFIFFQEKVLTNNNKPIEKLLFNKFLYFMWIGIFATFNYCYQPILSFSKKRSSAIPIFVQSGFRFALSDGHIKKTSFCCLKANRKEEEFTKVSEERPDIVVILQESTFFPYFQEKEFKKRVFFPETKPLIIHSTGGLTWVQEISLLHGVPPTLYGASWPISNLQAKYYYDGRLPVQLHSLGYESTSINLVGSKLYGIKDLHQALGMKNFVSCPEVYGCPGKPWSKISDKYLYKKILELLDKEKAIPKFLFGETIKQHSPHYFGIVSVGHSSCDKQLTEVQCEVLQEYKKRLVDSVEELNYFLNNLQKREKRTVVLVFGDHIPSDVNYFFSKKDFSFTFGQSKYQTFFSLWDSKKGFVTKEAIPNTESYKAIDVAFLDNILLTYLQFESNYTLKKQEFMFQKKGEFVFD